MRVRVKLISIAVVAAALAFVALALLADREPSYEGIRLSSWVEDYVGAWTPKPRVDDAMMHMGKKAIPYLVSWMRQKSLEPKISIASKLHCPTTAINWLRSTDRRRCHRAEAACTALKALGSDAQDAIPKLKLVLKDGNNYEGCRRALNVLLNLGKPGLDPMLVGLSNENRQVRLQTLYAIMWANTNTERTVTSLRQAVKDADPTVSSLAAIALGQIEHQTRATGAAE